MTERGRDDPIVLEATIFPYAPVSRVSWIVRFLRRLSWKWLFPLLAVALLAIGAYFTLDYGTISYSCLNCGARRSERIFDLLSFESRYNEDIIEGPISKFVQKHNGRCAAHQWEMADESRRLIGATGRGYGRFRFVSIVEAYPKELERVLERGVNQEGDFVAALTNAVKSENEMSRQFRISLTDEIWSVLDIAGGSVQSD